MELTHPDATWTLKYTDARATGPQKLESQGATLLSFVHCRVDGTSDDDFATVKARHFRKSGNAVFEGEGTFTGSIPLRLRQTQRIAGNAVRITYDLAWPKSTPLKNGLELGSCVLAGNWQRFFTVDEGTTAVDWKEIPADSTSPIVLSPLPCAIVLEDERGRRLEWGLGDDLWRWTKGLNGEFLHATGRMELSRSGANRLTLRRYVAFCDPTAEEKAAAALEKDPRFQGKADENGNLPAPVVPTSQPEARNYRFGAYFAWSEPDLVVDGSVADTAKELAFDAKNGIDHGALAALSEKPSVALDMTTCGGSAAKRAPGEAGAPRSCWASRAAQNTFRKVIRQLAAYSPEGTLVLRGMAPGWCTVASHEGRLNGKPVRHWDLPLLLEVFAWARQTLGNGWTILVPQTGIWQELPSLEALGAPTGFRNENR